jgi:pimeloyl-ACP methyl ester carboxylesterase
MNKKRKMPFVLRIIQWVFPKMERLIPSVAHWYFIKLFFSPLQYMVPEKEKKAETYAKKFNISITGKMLQCYSWGNANKYILCVHGWAGRATQFRRFIKPLLAAGYKVIAFDGPAHGNSEGKRTTIFEFEEALQKIYDAVGEPHAIIAHSFGGGAVLFAAMNGLSVNKLINISSPTIGDEIIKTYLRAINGSQKTSDFFKAYMKRTFNKSFDEFSALHSIQRLPKKINLLMIQDEDDNEVSMENPLALQKIYPDAKLYTTKGLGHTRILKDDEVIQYCVTYLTT